MNRLLVTTVCSVMFVATSLAWAQQPTPPALQPQQTRPGTVEFVNAQQQSDWLASALIGRTVTNAQGETLGDINDLIIDEQGTVVAVIIGVGGFLGVGEKDVGVRYSALQFQPRPEPVRVSPPVVPGQQPGADPARPAPLPEPRDRPQAIQRQDPKHRDKVIVLEVSKEQLAAAPPYRQLGETQGSKN
jgi:sporulation protein YlmC with PRC-barrel domain